MKNKQLRNSFKTKSYNKPNHQTSHKQNDTSWQKVADWYNKSVGKEGHYFHKSIILPKSLDLLKLDNKSSLLDLACGQGILSHHIPSSIEYTGIDLSSSLITFANKEKSSQHHSFIVNDVSHPLPLTKSDFTHCTVILAMQNIEDQERVIQNAYKHLDIGGKFLIVLNHPMFRIPRQTSWEIDLKNKVQYRRINRYYSSIKIPIEMNPGQKQNNKVTWSFHRPLEFYANTLGQNGFMIRSIEEWNSDKVSVGKAAKMENLARNEFPMFMAILAIKTK